MSSHSGAGMGNDERHTLLGYLLNMPLAEVRALARSKAVAAEVAQMANDLLGPDGLALVLAFVDAGRP